MIFGVIMLFIIGISELLQDTSPLKEMPGRAGHDLKGIILQKHMTAGQAGRFQSERPRPARRSFGLQVGRVAGAGEGTRTDNICRNTVYSCFVTAVLDSVAVPGDSGDSTACDIFIPG